VGFVSPWRRPSYHFRFDRFRLAGMHEPARLQPLTEVIGTECGPVVALLASSLQGWLKVPLVLAHIASASLSFMPMRASVQLLVLLPMH
jgi:hypothetical protein